MASGYARPPAGGGIHGIGRRRRGAWKSRGSAAPSPGPTTNGCTTLQPGSNWICVNGGWLPPDHRCRRFRGLWRREWNRRLGPGGSSGATGTCTTPDPFIGTEASFGHELKAVSAAIGSPAIIRSRLPCPCPTTGSVHPDHYRKSCSPGFPEIQSGACKRPDRADGQDSAVTAVRR